MARMGGGQGCCIELRAEHVEVGLYIESIFDLLRSYLIFLVVKQPGITLNLCFFVVVCTFWYVCV